MTQRQGHFLEDIVVGMSETLTKTVSDADILNFADITGDHNPVHLDDDYAAGTTVTVVEPDRRRITMETVCKVGDMVVVEGEAQMMVSSRIALAAQ